MVHPYSPAECDELELRTGDYVYIAPDALASSQDGWVEGTSWLTGQGGLFPHSYTQRTAETDAWTLHEKLPLNTKAQNAGSDVEEAPPMPKIENIYENVLKMKRVGSAETENQVGCLTVVVRHIGILIICCLLLSNLLGFNMVFFAGLKRGGCSAPQKTVPNASRRTCRLYFWYLDSLLF